MIVVMPLITGGALQQVLRQFGIRLPMGLSRGAGSSTSLFSQLSCVVSVFLWGKESREVLALRFLAAPPPPNQSPDSSSVLANGTLHSADWVSEQCSVAAATRVTPAAVAATATLAAAEASRG